MEKEVKKEEKEVKNENNKETKKNNNRIIKLIILISMFSLVFLMIAIIAIILIIRHINFKKPIKQVWGETYYEYLKDYEKNNSTTSASTNIKEPKKYKLHFYDVKALQEPVMVSNYEYNKENYVNVYYIKNGKVTCVKYLSPARVELLYNIEKQEYNYYLVNKGDSVYFYQELGNKILSGDPNSGVTEESITINENDARTVTDVNGNDLSIDKYDETFIKPEVNDEGISFEIGQDERKLKQSIADEAEDFEDVKEITENKELSQYVKEKLDEVAKKQKELDDAALEVQKKKEEEEKKKALEEAKKRLKVGDYTITYGTYRWEMDGIVAATVIINNDGTCMFNQEKCTYTISSHDFAQDISTAGHPKTCIAFMVNGYNRYLMPYKNDVLGDGDMEYFTLIKAND